MTTEQTASVVIGLLAGVGTAVGQVTQEPSSLASLAGIGVPVLSALIGGAMGYGVLKTTVDTVRHDLLAMRADLSDVHHLLRDVSTRVARIEGRIDAEG
jgi:Zn-dependent protease